MEILCSLKWVSFVLFAFVCSYKVFEGYQSLLAKETGTKTELLGTSSLQLPSFAICRHPIQILDGVALQNQYNLSLPDMRKMSSYEQIENYTNETYSEVFSRHLLDPRKIIKRVELKGVTASADMLLPSYTSKPDDTKEDWTELYHPIYGRCLGFKPNQEIMDRMIEEEGGIDSIYFALNMIPPLTPVWQSLPERWPKVRDPPKRERMQPDVKDVTENYHEMSKDLEEEEVTIFVYQEGSFFNSKTGAIARLNSRKIYILEQEVIDRSKAPGPGFQCDSEQDENGLSEDDCLYECLVDRFRKEFGCDHPRLRFLSKGRRVEGLNVGRKYCRFEDLAKFQRPYLRDIQNRTKESNLTKISLNADEVGLARLKSLMASFHTYGEDKRCQCKPPCKRNFLQLRQWEPSETGNAEDGVRKDDTFIMFKMKPYVKVYHSHYLYTGSNLLADTGGYLGLFLGLSLFSLVELLETFVKNRRNRENGHEDTKKQNGEVNKEEIETLT